MESSASYNSLQDADSEEAVGRDGKAGEEYGDCKVLAKVGAEGWGKRAGQMWVSEKAFWTSSILSAKEKYDLTAIINAEGVRTEVLCMGE